MWYWDTMLSTEGQCQGCPFWCQSAWKEDNWRGGAMPNRTGIWHFEGVNADEMSWSFHGTIPAPWPLISTWIHSSGPPAPVQALKNPSPGWEVAMLREAAKREQQSKLPKEAIKIGCVCSNGIGSHWHAKQDWNLAFWGGKHWWNWLKFLWG